MTLQVSGQISLTDVLNELRIANAGRTLPISLGDADVRALAGKPSGPISLSDLYGKSAIAPMSINAISDYAFTDSQAGNGTAACSPSVQVSGGVPPYSYLWQILANNGGLTLSNANNIACVLSRSFIKNSNGIATANMRVTVTDSQGTTRQSDGASGTVEWGGNA